MFIAACASCLGLYFYIVCASNVGRRSTPATIANITYPRLGIVLDGCVALKSVGVSLSYLLMIGNIMSTFMMGILGPESESVFVNPRIWIIFFMIVVVPLSFLRKMDTLKYSSILGLMSVVYLTGLSLVHLITRGVPQSALDSIQFFAPLSVKSLSRFGVFVFAFTCHQNVKETLRLHPGVHTHTCACMFVLRIFLFTTLHFCCVSFGRVPFFGIVLISLDTADIQRIEKKLCGTADVPVYYLYCYFFVHISVFWNVFLYLLCRRARDRLHVHVL